MPTANRIPAAVAADAPGVFQPGQRQAAFLHHAVPAAAGLADVVTVIATEPLTENETWTRYEPGQWSLWRRGECVSQGKTE